MKNLNYDFQKLLKCTVCHENDKTKFIVSIIIIDQASLLT